MAWRVVTWNSKTDREFATRQEALDYITMNDDSGDWHIEPIAPLTMFLCGPSKCEPHDYSGWQDIVVNGQVRGGTTVCAKCGSTAFDEAAWL